jgi:2-keto-4-pentenoate hydratase/2-oxohepta-3-ene-1,7-dioic acid hydratase in catechol pathway
VDNEELKLGVKVDKGIIDIVDALEQLKYIEYVPKNINQVIKGGKKALESLQNFIYNVQQSGNESFSLQEKELKIAPCVLTPSKIVCVGLNYRKHAEESNMPIPEYPILFNKFNNSISAHGDNIFLPFESKKIDYEAELGIVIGKRIKKVAKEDALDAVLGYCNVNDLTARDLQFRTNQWLLGKCLDGFSPIGPYIVTTDEVSNPNDLGIRCYVNGELRQDSSTSDMIFHCDEIVSYISQFMTLEPGDLILTGTPEGVILGYSEEKREWLKAGDKVTVEIDKLGQLTNWMKQEK